MQFYSSISKVCMKAKVLFIHSNDSNAFHKKSRMHFIQVCLREAKELDIQVKSFDDTPPTLFLTRNLL